MLAHEQQAWADGYLRIAGVDEAGRGPLAGPVTAAAVCFQRNHLTSSEATALWRDLNDSKKLRESARNDLYDTLTQHPAVTWSVVSVESDEIDRINILQATWAAMARALTNLQVVPATAPDVALVDGLRVKGLPIDHRPIVKGDGQSWSIAAASILAKVTRDRTMVALAETYPEYGFERHKGYGTEFHLHALRKHGPCPVHRRSFRPVAQRELFE